MRSYIPSPESFREGLVRKPASSNAVATVPDVTVVTVCRNPLNAGRRELFAKNLDSVQLQTGVVLEHLIIDSASTDGTMDFLMQYDNKHHDICILSKPDTGIYDAMNRGIALAQGKYVIFLNSDDYYHRTDGLAISMKALEKSGCCFSFAPILAKKAHGSSLRNPVRRLHKFFVFCVVRHPSVLFRRTDLIEIGGYDQSYRLAADFDIMLRLIATGRKACFVDTCFATFVEGGFAMQNRMLNKKEKVQIVKDIHSKTFGVDFSEQEAENIVRKCKYPRKYLSVYVESQKLIAHSFLMLPQDLTNRLTRRLNYVKYYLKCLLS